MKRLAIFALFLAAGAFAGAFAGERFSRDYFGEPVDSYTVQPLLPGTNTRDYSAPGYVIERYHDGTEVGYPTLPGTNVPDYSQPGYRIQRRDP